MVDGEGDSSGSSDSSSAMVSDDSLIVSQSSYDQKMRDLDELNKEKIPPNSQAIEAAREAPRSRRGSKGKGASPVERAPEAEAATIEEP